MHSRAGENISIASPVLQLVSAHVLHMILQRPTGGQDVHAVTTGRAVATVLVKGEADKILALGKGEQLVAPKVCGPRQLQRSLCFAGRAIPLLASARIVRARGSVQQHRRPGNTASLTRRHCLPCAVAASNPCP